MTSEAEKLVELAERLEIEMRKWPVGSPMQGGLADLAGQMRDEAAALRARALQPFTSP
jgi:hypothetical protein